jgi:hypothetical protein
LPSASIQLQHHHRLWWQLDLQGPFSQLRPAEHHRLDLIGLSRVLREAGGSDSNYAGVELSISW